MKAVPVTILTGFLGSGKTTLLNRLLGDPEIGETAVIVNEFGEISVDHLLVERVSEDIIEIAGGCLCCTVQGELAETLATLVDRMQTRRIKPLARIIIETTGMADPVPVLHAIQSHPALIMALTIDRVITTVDVTGLQQINDFAEARNQISAADMVILTKTDLADRSAINAAMSKVQSLSAGTVIFGNDLIKPFAELFEPSIFRSAKISGHHHHHTGVESLILENFEPMPLDALSGFLDLVALAEGDRILRTKGVVRTVERPEQPLVVQGVRNRIYPFRWLEQWSNGQTKKTLLVIIGKNLDRRRIMELFDAFSGRLEADLPDRTALEANPLAIPGGVSRNYPRSTRNR